MEPTKHSSMRLILMGSRNGNYATLLLKQSLKQSSEIFFFFLNVSVRDQTHKKLCVIRMELIIAYQFYFIDFDSLYLYNKERRS